jgi:lysophospholipase L1-like esterase
VAILLIGTNNIDINHVFLRPDGKINTDLMPDLVHPNAAGAKAAAVALEPLFRETDGRPAGG